MGNTEERKKQRRIVHVLENMDEHRNVEVIIPMFGTYFRNTNLRSNKFHALRSVGENTKFELRLLMFGEVLENHEGEEEEVEVLYMTYNITYADKDVFQRLPISDSICQQSFVRSVLPFYQIRLVLKLQMCFVLELRCSDDVPTSG